MSGIAGILNKDGQPVDRGLLSRLTGAISSRGPDGSGVWFNGNVGLGFQAFWTTPEDVGLTAPIFDPESGLVIVIDGRIDNRAELLEELSLMPDIPDARLVLAAYRKWGEGCPEHLLGDFAIAIWDSGSQRLFCIRDRFAICPFYFADTPKCFVFASELQAVLTHPAVSSRLNEGMLAEMLSNNIASRTETLFADVSRLEPRHSLSISAANSTRRCYWHPDLTERKFTSEDDCAGEFLDLLKTAVKCRLRRTGPAATFLSGGLDSSAVTALASQIIPADQIQTFSSTFPGYPTDETFYIDLNTGRYPVQSHRVPYEPPPPDYYFTWAARYRDFPGYPNGNALLHGLALTQQQQGVRVILGGQGGNQLFDGWSSVIADDLRTFRLADFWRNARAYSYRGVSPFTTALSLGVRPLLPKPVWLRRLLRRPPPSFYPLHPDFIRRTSLAERIQLPPDWRPFGSMARRDVVTAMFSPLNGFMSEQVSRDSAYYGIEERVPFLDTRLVEFAIRLPEQMRQRNGVWKYLMRRALADLLPAEVVNRQIQAEFTRPALSVLKQQQYPDLQCLDDFISPGFLRSLDATGGAAALISRADLGIQKKWAILGTGYFLANEKSRI